MVFGLYFLTVEVNINKNLENKMVTKEISDITKEIMDTRDIESFMEDIENDIGNLEDEIEINKDAVELLQEKLGDYLTNDELGEVNSEIEDLDDECEDLNSDLQELKELLEKLENIRSEVPEFSDGNTLVRSDVWEDYVKDLLEDCGDIPSDLPHYIVIDWDATSENIAQDYGTIEIDGDRYYFRNC
jgi:DNA repair exonuclease SbcCD ATPase subunit